MDLYDICKYKPYIYDSREIIYKVFNHFHKQIKTSFLFLFT